MPTASFVAMAVVCCHGRHSQRLRNNFYLGHGIVCCHNRHSLLWPMPTIRRHVVAVPEPTIRRSFYGADDNQRPGRHC
jgi:hypothetical protein